VRTIVLFHSGSSSVEETTYFDGVELVGELALDVRPDRREAVVGHAAQEERVRRHRLVELELVALRPAREVVDPADASEILGAARRFDDAVDGDVLGYDDSSHLNPSSIPGTRAGAETHR
jgi:hypothetical protein